MPETRTIEDWRALIDRFNNRTIERHEWSHVEHIVVALWFICKYRSLNRALVYLRPGFVVTVDRLWGTSDEMGYHETLTMFWAKRVHTFAARRQSHSFDDLLPLVLSDKDLMNKKLALRYYSEQRLFSLAARARYLPPT